VRDHESQVQDVLDGDLDAFIASYLRRVSKEVTGGG
jgi:hypothetical protein